MEEMILKTKKEVLSGNQAIARGFYEAGGEVATAYPGLSSCF